MAIKIKVNRRIIPMIYAYTTPEIARYIIDNNIVQGNALTQLNNSDELVVFSEWIKQDDKVKQLQFTFKSLVEDNFNSFDMNRQIELLDEDKPSNDGFIKITKVYKNKLGGL